MATGTLEEGTLLEERYLINEAVGRGGMGAVYRARDTRLESTVAIKELLRLAVSEDERLAAVRQFEREARLLGQLAHPNLPRVTDYFVEDGRCYLVMEFIEGDTLDAILQDFHGASIPLADALTWALQVADVLAYLHSQDPPIVFRDLKPANIMLADSGVIKLIDFGIARRYDASATKDTLLYGSPGYSPPEQYGRTQTDPRADIYALGATLHHLVTGRDPSPTPFKFPPIRSIDPSLPPELESLIARCVEMDPERRVGSAAEVRDALVRIRDAAVDRPASTTGPQRPIEARRGRASGMRALLRAAVGLVALSAAGVAGYGLWRAGQGTADRHRLPTPVARPAPAVTPAPTSAQLGSIDVTSIPPGATIYVDGRQVGTTPLLVGPVAPGAHTLRIAAPSGSGLADWTSSIEVAPGGAVPVSAVLAQAQQAQPQGPAVALENASAASVLPQPGRSNAIPGLVLTLTFQVSGAAGKSGSVAAYFYEPDGSTPIKSQDTTGTYQNADGQLSVAASFQADQDPAKFRGFRLFVPQSAIPAGYDVQSLKWRLAFYVDGKLVDGSPASTG